MKRTLVFWALSVSAVVTAISLIGCSAASSGGGGGTQVYHIGETGPAGGIVFFDQGTVTNGWRYLEAAPSDLSGSFAWGGYGITAGGNGNTEGAGKANTAAIVSSIGAGTYAAEACQNYSLNGFSDWYLPCGQELNDLFLNLSKEGIGGITAGSNYWTSFEISTTQADAGYYASGGDLFSGQSKLSSLLVRPIRQFAP